MIPSYSQVAQAAYYRWERRRGVHGRDCDDWLASEQDLLFSFNYALVAHYPLDGGQERSIGDPGRRKCRFCELAGPRASFGGKPLAIPAYFGNRDLFANDQCEDCRALFAESIDGDLEAFARPFLSSGSSEERRGVNSNGHGAWHGGTEHSGHLRTDPHRPLAAFKGLTKLALSIMPDAEMPYFEDAVEWVSNPDHDDDASLFEGVRCYVHERPSRDPLPSWTALARRVDPDAQVPYMLFFLGTRRITFQAAVPLCPMDDEHDGEPFIIPTIADPLMVGQDEAPVSLNVIRLSSTNVSRDVECHAWTR